MGSSEHTGARLVRDPPSRKDEERLFGCERRCRRAKESPELGCKKRGLFRKRWEVDVGAEVTPPSAGIVFGAEVLMHCFGCRECLRK